MRRLLIIAAFHMVVCLVPVQKLRQQPPAIKLGVDVLLSERLDLIRHHRVGLITNPTGLTSDYRSTIDALKGQPQVQLTALFGPEHGVRGDVPAGEHVQNYIDPKTGVQVFSLYGRQNKPTPEMLRDVDVLLYDIQDIGSRAYTYIYTMALAMEAARENNKPFIVLDRPNPLGGHLVEGPVLDPAFKSFIGLFPIPYVYGMTVGELAQLFNNEFGIHCDLTVIPMKGWRRDMSFNDTGLIWVPTSPHVPHFATCYYIAATGCIGELGTINEGVGYPMPFELIGAPWINAELLAKELNGRELPGVLFRPLNYRPYYGAFKEKTIPGIQIHIRDHRTFQPMRTQIHILHALRTLFPEQDFFATRRITSFNHAMGTDLIQKQLSQGLTADEIVANWQKDLEAFAKIRIKYLLYK